MSGSRVHLSDAIELHYIRFGQARNVIRCFYSRVPPNPRPSQTNKLSQKLKKNRMIRKEILPCFFQQAEICWRTEPRPWRPRW